MLADRARLTLEIQGMNVIQPGHPQVLRLNRKRKPTDHGHKVWPTNWVLIDHLKKTRLARGRRVLEFGCGWGLLGVWCASQAGSQVVCVDVDPRVGPFVQLMAEANDVSVDFIAAGFEEMEDDLLAGVNLLVASDIVYCDTLIDPLRRMFDRARRAGVSRVLISDPGRWPFRDLCGHLKKWRGYELIEWRTDVPKEQNAMIVSLGWSGGSESENAAASVKQLPLIQTPLNPTRIRSLSCRRACLEEARQGTKFRLGPHGHYARVPRLAGTAELGPIEPTVDIEDGML